MKNSIVIFRVDIANDLIKRGFTVDALRYNDKVAGNLVVLFRNTKEIREVLRKEYNINIT